MNDQQDISKLEVPVMKKDGKVMVEIDYQTVSGIVNSLYLIASMWDKSEVQEFKDLIENRKQITDHKQICYLILDGFYKQILQKAKETDQLEMTSLDKTFNVFGGLT